MTSPDPRKAAARRRRTKLAPGCARGSPGHVGARAHPAGYLHFNGHFRAEDSRRALRETGAAVSLVTVYRNLPMLERAGVIRRTCLVAGASRWERCWQDRHHDHLICTACGKVVEFEYRAIDVLQELAAAEHGFQAHGHHLELLGLSPRPAASARLLPDDRAAPRPAPSCAARRQPERRQVGPLPGVDGPFVVVSTTRGRRWRSPVARRGRPADRSR